MKLIYEIISNNRITSNDKNIFIDKVAQTWELTFKRQPGIPNFELIIDTIKFPKNESVDMKPIYNLLDIVVKPSEQISMLIDNNGDIKKINNLKAIEDKWKACRHEIPLHFGEDEAIKNMIQKLDEGFCHYGEEIRSNLYYFILLSQWKKQKKIDFKTRCNVSEDLAIDLEIRCGNKAKGEDGKIYWQQIGEGYPASESKLKKFYNKELKPYVKEDYNHKYTYDTKYIFSEQPHDGFVILEKSITQIYEQASIGYQFYNTIEMNLIKE